MNQINYQKELEKIISTIPAGTYPKLLLHSCCAPCSSYCMEYLREFFDITVFYYNPNISSEMEYRKRVEEEKRLINEYNSQVDYYNGLHNTEEWDLSSENSPESSKLNSDGKNIITNGMTITPFTRKIDIIEGDYIPSEFYDYVKGYEKCPEGGERCFKCFELRLRRSFELARELGMDYVTTTLTISPLKNAAKINEIGMNLEIQQDNLLPDDSSSAILKPKWLPSDFKKNNGYKRSIELSREYDLYRQNFCGCVFSKRED